MYWIIESNLYRDDETGEALYWNNDEGWVDHESSTRFTAEEKSQYDHIPMSGQWIVCQNSAQQV